MSCATTVRVIEEARAAGLDLVREEHDLLPYQFFLELGRSNERIVGAAGRYDRPQ